MSMTIEIAEKIAKKNGWMVNPDRGYAQEVINGLNTNKRERGDYYCPVVVNDSNRNRKCPCKKAKNEIESHGLCHWGLYVKPQIFTCPNCGNARDERENGYYTPSRCPACNCPLTGSPENIHKWKKHQRQRI